MNNSDAIIKILQKNLPLLRQKYGLCTIGIFGSYSRGDAKKESDVDLVVEFEKPLGLAFIDFCEEIEKLLSKKVDVLTKTGMKAIRNKKIAHAIENELIYV